MSLMVTGIRIGLGFIEMDRNETKQGCLPQLPRFREAFSHDASRTPVVEKPGARPQSPRGNMNLGLVAGSLGPVLVGILYRGVELKRCA